MNNRKKELHNKYAPYWAAAMIVFGLAGLSTVWFDTGDFGSGYGIDMMGPAWNYILFRGLFTGYTENRWRRFFTPTRTFFIFIIVAYGIETAQYLEWYDSTFDPLDFAAYISLLLPIYLIDMNQQKGTGTMK